MGCPLSPSLDEAAIGIHDALDAAAEPSACVGHHVLVQAGHYLGDLGLQRCLGVVRALVDFPFTNAPQEEVAGIAVW